ncbi:hypothetical protein [Argonema galeatum]|uniref:hypothetical protein n=1 Tax=Argonema galeatum TaxID=2942762 RepID=UPI002010DAFC|nr:hypothetical protein [Argonema galeatum]MCL1464725.1 hypothetical protein [Argonema galeatum A003/A1]
MVNILEPGDSELVSVDYTDLLQKILQTLRGQNPFRIAENGQRLAIDIDAVASHVASLPIQNPLSSPNGVRSATINFSPGFRDNFPNKIREIRDCLTQLLESSLGSNRSIEEFVNGLVTPLESFQGNPTGLGLTYTFNRPSPNLQKQKLCLDSNRPGSASLLKFHKLTITVREIDRFPEYLKEGLENHIDRQVTFERESHRKELHDTIQERIEDEYSDFNRLKRIVDTETLGKLKKEAKIRYLEYLRDNIETKDSVGFIYLQDLIRRLRLIEDFINQDKADSYYDVNYANSTINYKDEFSRSEVLDSLPIIPIVTGNLGESTDINEGERKFIFGLKMKFGNPVEAHKGLEVFDYNLNLIDPDSAEHRHELERKPNFGSKILKLAFLYFFVFACNNPNVDGYNPNDDLNYNPIIPFKKILPDLQGNNEEIKKRRLKAIWRGLNEYKIREKIKVLRELLREFIKNQTILPTRTYPVQISVRRGILETDENKIFNDIFFREVVQRNPKECLRYISIGKVHVDENAVCQLPASIEIKDIRYFSTEERQEFRMEYDLTGVNTLPVMWVPESCINAYQNHFMRDRKLLLFRYDNRRLEGNGFNSTQGFLYRFTISLLAYICLKILLDAAKKRLFVPMVRLHEGTHQNPALSEKFMAHLSKTLCHLVNEKHRCNSQGFRVQDANPFKVKNGLSSLYSVLPRKFRFTDTADTPTLDKLAIIIVSSLESDARTGNRNRKNRISNLVGEAIGVTRQQDGAIRLYIIKTFSDNYSNQRLYHDPPILIDTVNNLYQQGYRHFLYVAQAPFTSNLNITQSEDDDSLYFMSPKLINNLKGNRDDIQIYPVFFDKYYVRKAVEPKATSFYIQDTKELLNVAKDSTQQAVVFFNLFNGISVGKGDDRFYNGVISYSTLLNIYPGILDDKYIRSGLIDDDSMLKNDILQYLTLFHFSRFEKTSDISLKLDPYENIIGEESFSKLSVFNHMRGEVGFNSLAFLSEVKKALNV